MSSIVFELALLLAFGDEASLFALGDEASLFVLGDETGLAILLEHQSFNQKEKTYVELRWSTPL